MVTTIIPESLDVRPNVRDEEIVSLTNDPVVGGSFSYVVKRGEDIINHRGTYIEIHRPNRLVFTWNASDDDNDSSTVEIELKQTSTGCKLTLTHSMDKKWEEYKDRTAHGWSFMIDKLHAELNKQ